MILQSAVPARSVLVVEDNPGDARLVELFLHEDPSRPFKVRKVALLSEALSALDEPEQFDVVLLDLHLPDSSGLTTLARLRAAHPALPIVVLTGTNDEALALEALRQGAQDYLVKGQGDGELVRRAVRYAIERSRVDRALRDSETRFRAVFENAPIGVVLSEADGTILDANPAFCTMVGHAPNELHGAHFRAITHDEDVDENLRMQTEMIDGRRDTYQLSKRYMAKNGHLVWGRLTAAAVRDDGGALRYTVAVIEDVTERKRLEEHMRLAATVFENTGEGLFVTDADTRIIHVNPAFTDITGFGPGDVIGQTPKVLSSGRHGPEFYARMWQAITDDGRWQGELWDRRKTGEMFASWVNIAAVRDGEGAVTNFVCVFSDITSRKQIEERLSYQANHDPLTRLPNRTLFQERLSRALARAHRNQHLIALLFVDLDHFKQVNDTLGHLAGDQLLQEVAERLSSCTRQGDTVARLSGDEFTVILEDIQDPRDAAVVAHKILHLLTEPFVLSGNEARISSSIGVALYPVDAVDPQGLVRLADAAMYRAKNQGRNACQFHSEAVNAQAFERLALENSLRGAVDRQEFTLFYQPVYDLATARPVAVEALLRWQHPEVGMVVPSQFISLADETGMILPIGRWVLKQACNDIRKLREELKLDLAVHINLTGRQLRQLDLIEAVAEALEDSGLPPQSLVLEIPESSIVDKGHEAVGQIMTRFAALRLGIAIDEFGAGYSSFSFLRRLPVGALKISQPFVRAVADGSEDSEIVTAIVAVARGLHMTVIAPGVETEEQLNTLASYGCNRVQGFLLARPMPIGDLRAFLSRGDTPKALAKRTSP